MSLTFALFEFGGGVLAAEDGTPIAAEDAALLIADGTANDITDDVMTSPPLQWTRGITGTGVTDRVATAGQLSFNLKNDAGNSAGVLGYYSPNNGNKKAGWDIGQRVQLRVTDGSTVRYKFFGVVTGIQPEAGIYAGRSVSVTASDYIWYLANQRLSLLPILDTVPGDTVVDYLVDTMPIQPQATSYAAGVYTFPTALDTERDERSTALNAIAKVCASDLSYFFVRGDATTGEQLTLESTATRAGRFTISAVLDTAITGLQVNRTASNIYNDIRVSVYPRRVDAAATTVIASLDREITIAAGATETITLRYTDPSGAGTRISAKDQITPTGSDLVFTSGTGGSGSSLAASLAITPTYGANSATFALANNSGGTGYLSVFRVKGRGIYLYNPAESAAMDADSQGLYGAQTLNYQMPYMDAPATGQAYANELLAQYAEPYTDVGGVTFSTRLNATLEEYAVRLDVGDRVSITEQATGIMGDFFVQSVSHEYITPTAARVNLTVIPVRTGADIFIVDSGTNGLLGTNKIG